MLKQIEPKKIYIFINKEVITTPGIYHNPDLGLITLSSDGNNWITIADKNLGATTVFEVGSGSGINGGATVNEANGGKFYQWGNNYGFPYTGATSTSPNQVNTTNYGPGNYYNSPTFVYRSSSPYNWQISINKNLWGGETGTNEAMRGPCPEGFHIPKYSEFTDFVNTINNFGITGRNIEFCLKMPATSNLAYNSGSLAGNNRFCEFYCSDTFKDGTGKIYWLYDNYGNSVEFQEVTVSMDSNGYTIRPFKNEREYPTDEWTVLFQPE